MKAIMNWSGGKDSALALHRCLEGKDLEIGCLLTNRVASSNRVAMHGVRWALIEAQALSIGLPLKSASLPPAPSTEAYEAAIARPVLEMKKLGYSTAVFGDIFLEDLKAYRQAQMSKLGVDACFPLWREAPKKLMAEFLHLGFKAVVVCVDTSKLDPAFCGRVIDHQFFLDLPKEVDICGERGEFHSFVYDGPIFGEPVRFRMGDRTVHSIAAPQEQQRSNELQAQKIDFVYQDLLPESE